MVAQRVARLTAPAMVLANAAGVAVVFALIVCVLRWWRGTAAGVNKFEGDAALRCSARRSRSTSR